MPRDVSPAATTFIFKRSSGAASTFMAQQSAVLCTRRGTLTIVVTLYLRVVEYLLMRHLILSTTTARVRGFAPRTIRNIHDQSPMVGS